MRRIKVPLFFILLSLFSPSFGQKIPQPVGYVSDFAGVVGGDYTSRIEYLSKQLKEKTGAEIAVVTVESLGELGPEKFANELFQKWGIGQKGKDNGVLILLAIANKKVRIEPGYGLEGPLPDGFCGGIIREVMLPHFRVGDYGKGLYLGIAALAQRIASEYGVELSDQGGNRLTPYSPASGTYLRGLILAFVFFFFFSLIFLLRGRFLFPFLLGMGMGMGRGFWSGGSFGGGGFGGGFGGFGGGSSGGGGATGGW